MKKNDIIRFSYMAGAIALLLLFFTYAKMQEKAIETRREATLAPFFTGKPSDVGYIAISKGQNLVELENKDSRWYVQLPDTLFPAPPDDVKELLDYFCGLTPENLVDEGDKSYAEYEVDDVNAVSVRLYGKKGEQKPLLEMFMGKSGSDYYSIYVRKGGINAVFQVAQNKSTLWTRDVRLWRDKYPLRENRDDFNTITINAKGSSFTLKRDETGFWKFADDAVSQVNQELVVSLVSRLTGLVGLQIVDAVTPDMKLDQPEYEFGLAIGSRKTVITISSDVHGKRYVRNSELNQAYEISAAAVDGIKVERKDYVKAEEAPPTTASNGDKPSAPESPAAPTAPPASPEIPPGSEGASGK